MDRDHLEAVIWQHWPTRGPQAADAVDAILAAADAYALDQYGISAERRQVLAEAAAAAVHYIRLPTSQISACGRAGRCVTSQWAGACDPARVTCAACKRCHAYRTALAGAA